MKLKTLVVSAAVVSTLASVAAAAPDDVFDRIDTNHDGRWTPSEVQAAAAGHIKAADRDGDNAATRQEIRAYYWAKRAKGDAGLRATRPAPTSMAQRVALNTARFAKLDVNHDGLVLQAEATTIPKALFRKLDSDTDGRLTLKEFAALIRSGAPSNAALTVTRDTNGDGRVDVLEAQAAAMRQFARLDNNQDGVVTKDEVQAARLRTRQAVPHYVR